MLVYSILVMGARWRSFALGLCAPGSHAQRRAICAERRIDVVDALKPHVGHLLRHSHTYHVHVAFACGATSGDGKGGLPAFAIKAWSRSRLSAESTKGLLIVAVSSSSSPSLGSGSSFVSS